MTFQIKSLSAVPFKALFERPDTELKSKGMRRVFADADQGYPCRIALADVPKGEELLLLNYAHLQANSPYDATHAIYVGKSSEPRTLNAGEVPDMITMRQISLRGFDTQALMQVGEVVEGADVATRLERAFADPQIDFVDLHSAMRGCFLARATRA